MGKTIIFCRTYKECAELYTPVCKLLGKAATHPAGAPDLQRFRIVDMYCQCTETCLKEKIVLQFTDPSSCLRVVIATIAFGMGLDCPCVRTVMHWGPSLDTEQYMSKRQDGVDAMAHHVSYCYSGQSRPTAYCKKYDVKIRQAVGEKNYTRSLIVQTLLSVHSPSVTAVIYVHSLVIVHNASGFLFSL